MRFIYIYRDLCPSFCGLNPGKFKKKFNNNKNFVSSSNLIPMDVTGLLMQTVLRSYITKRGHWSFRVPTMWSTVCVSVDISIKTSSLPGSVSCGFSFSSSDVLQIPENQ